MSNSMYNNTSSSRRSSLSSCNGSSKCNFYIPSNLLYTYRRYSNYIFILNWTPGSNGLAKGNGKTRQQSLKFADLVRLILEILRYSALFGIDNYCA